MLEVSGCIEINSYMRVLFNDNKILVTHVWFIISTLSTVTSTIKSREMAINSVCLLFCCCYLLLASGVSGIAPVTYPGKISSECSQDNPVEDEQLMNS